MIRTMTEDEKQALEKQAWDFISRHKKKRDHVDNKGRVLGHVRTYESTDQQRIKRDVAFLKATFPNLTLRKTTPHPSKIDVFGTYYDFYPINCAKCNTTIRHDQGRFPHKVLDGPSFFTCSACNYLMTKKEHQA